MSRRPIDIPGRLQTSERCNCPSLEGTHDRDEYCCPKDDPCPKPPLAAAEETFQGATEATQDPKELEILGLRARLGRAGAERDEAYRQLHAIMCRISDLDPDDECSAALVKKGCAGISEIVVEWVEKQVKRKAER